jgi:hypothetical protein
MAKPETEILFIATFAIFKKDNLGFVCWLIVQASELDIWLLLSDPQVLTDVTLLAPRKIYSRLWD